ncbi:MAG: hypothetical protein ACRDL2_11165 [Gaiellaceae bacterium]
MSHRAAALVVLIAAAAGLMAAEAASSTHPFSCPRNVVNAVYVPPATVARTALKLVPVEYASLSSMGKRAWPYAGVHGVVSLAKRLQPPQPPLRSLVVRLCGLTVADASWAVFFYFGNCQLPCSEDTAIAARTKHGWVIWYSAYRRP